MKRYTRKLIKKRGGTNKRRGGTKKRGGGTKKKCEDFCKNDFVPTRRLIYQKLARDKNEVYVEQTPKEKKFSLKTCKKVYCNKSCKNKYQETGFYKDISNDFKTNYTNEEINKLQAKGAFSGCMKDDRYVDNYL